MNRYDILKLENQICFPMYAASREVIKRYHPYLKEINLTYTQYIAMLVFWEFGKISVRDLGEKLYLDSGTLTPLLKCLEEKGFIKRYRYPEDERVVIAEITEKGEALKEQAVSIPEKVVECIKMESEDAVQLYHLLYKLLAILDKKDSNHER